MEGAQSKLLVKKLHDHDLAVEFDLGGDPAQPIGVLAAGVGVQSTTSSSARMRAVGPAHPPFDDPELQVLLGAGHPGDASDEQPKRWAKSTYARSKRTISPGADAGAHLPGTGVVVVASGVDDGEAGQQALQIEPEMALGGRLAAAVLGPVHARGDQLDGRGIDNVDGALESVGQALAAGPGAEAWLNALKVIEHAPEQLLGHGCVADLVGVGKPVPARRSRCADPRQPPAVVAQAVADVIESDGVGQLAVEHGDHMAPGAEGPGLGVHAMFPRQFPDQMARDEVAKLGQNAEFAPGWSCPPMVCFFHTRSLPRPANLGNSSRLFSNPVGWL